MFGREDIANRAARSILANATAGDRPPSAVAPSVEFEAIGWLVLHEPREAETWLTSLETATQQGRSGWNRDDVVAIYKGWLMLGRPDRAEAYFRLVTAKTADGTDLLGPAELDAAGKWRNIKGNLQEIQADLFFYDVAMGIGDQTVDTRLSRATSLDERYRILEHCVEPNRQALGLTPPTIELPLDVAGRCARKLSALPPQKPVDDMIPEAMRRGFGQKRHAGRGDENTTEKRSGALRVAQRAEETGNKDLAREMLALALHWWRYSPRQSAVISDSEVTMAFEVVVDDLHARGKF